MSKIAKFTLTGEHAGKSIIINNRYVFEEGVYETNEYDGNLVKEILVEYYGCKLEWREDISKENEVKDSQNPSLKKFETSNHINPSGFNHETSGVPINPDANKSAVEAKDVVENQNDVLTIADVNSGKVDNKQDINGVSSTLSNVSSTVSSTVSTVKVNPK